MDEETEIIFLATLEDVKKYHYRLIENYSLDEWLADAENDYEKWAFTKFYEDLTTLNFLAESDIDDNKVGEWNVLNVSYRRTVAVLQKKFNDELGICP